MSLFGSLVRFQKVWFSLKILSCHKGRLDDKFGAVCMQLYTSEFQELLDAYIIAGEAASNVETC